MIINRIASLLFLLCFCYTVHSQTILSRVTFPVDEQQTLHDLAEAGLDLTHGHGTLHGSFTTELEDYELKALKKAGIRFTVDIPDLSQYRREQMAAYRGGGFLDCQNHEFNPNVPKNFELGSTGGFFSMPEILDHLDAMSILYPTLISVRRPIGNFKTYQNNNIYWVRISDNASTDEAEPEILYTGLHHAREFVTVSQMIYYMWYLLENYEKNPMIRQIVDHTELYFVPVVNPDGLNFNVAGYDPVEEQFDNNYRKNLRDNDHSGSFDPAADGVDLNRNYGFMWGHDDEGSSGNPGSINYRGPEPFSEPETQAISYFCSTHDFQIALNYHSYGDFLIYPNGFNSTHTEDSISFMNYAELLTALNGYTYGLGIETVGYHTNGDSDDWMYNTYDILAMTPEVGSEADGFYPIPQRIIPLCQSSLDMNLQAARLLNSLIVITDESPGYIHAGINPLDLEFNRYGLLNGEVQISFNALSPEIVEVPAPIQINLNLFEPHQRNLSFRIRDNVALGTKIKMEIVCQQGNYAFRDTLVKTRADFETLITDTGDLNAWDISNGQTWGTTPSEFKSGPVSITDSPSGHYGPNTEESIVLVQEVDLTTATSAYAQFWARWDIEDHYDYVVFQASTDGQNWENLCGEKSRLGSIFQLYEEPLYDGRQLHWVFENTDLSSYSGQLIQLRFLIVTDGFVHKDGFYFDDFKVVVITDSGVATHDIREEDFLITPNPARQYVSFDVTSIPDASVSIVDPLGHVWHQSAILPSQKHHTVYVQDWKAGIYHAVISSDQIPVVTRSFAVLR